MLTGRSKTLPFKSVSREQKLSEHTKLFNCYFWQLKGSFSENFSWRLQLFWFSWNYFDKWHSIEWKFRQKNCRRSEICFLLDQFDLIFHSIEIILTKYSKAHCWHNIFLKFFLRHRLNHHFFSLSFPSANFRFSRWSLPNLRCSWHKYQRHLTSQLS